MLGRWEQQSDPLTVTPPYDERIREFEQYFSEEMSAIGDEELDQERSMLERILAAA